MSTKGRILERVRKLLAKANDASSPEEAAIAASMAEKTMRKYQIENYEVTLADARLGATAQRFEVNRKVLPVWVGQLAVAVANLHEVFTYRIGGTGSLQFVGTDVDVAVATETLKYLMNTINRLAKAHKGGHKGNNSFRLGAVAILSIRLRELARERQEEFSSSKDLVVCKQAIIADWKREQGVTTRKGRQSKADVDNYAYAAGWRAGESISLNKQVTSC